MALHYDVAPQTLLVEVAPSLSSREPFEVRLPVSDFGALLERAVALTGDPAIGLRCGLHASEAAFDLMAPLIAHVPTLRDALREIRQFHALAFDAAHLHLSERMGVARLRCDFPRQDDATDRHIAELLMAGFMRLLRGFGCTRQDLHATRFEHRTPAYHHRYAEAFEGSARFAEEVTALEFSAELLDRPHLHSNPALHDLLHSQAEQRLARIARPRCFVEGLKVYLISHPASRTPEMGAAARELGVSVRTLRRRLAERNTSYRSVLGEVQRERACALLRNPDLTLQQVADEMGFSDAPPFHRAFKRWTGMTACEYRKRH
ncbi:MAG: AraC family transcriptional regulator ligand-binding domain-containing protein [Myxococcales bacterium]